VLNVYLAVFVPFIRLHWSLKSKGTVRSVVLTEFLIKIQVFLHYDVSAGKQTPTFRISCNLHLPALWITCDWSDPEDGKRQLPKMPVTIYQSTWRLIPENLNHKKLITVRKREKITNLQIQNISYTYYRKKASHLKRPADTTWNPSFINSSGHINPSQQLYHTFTEHFNTYCLDILSGVHTPGNRLLRRLSIPLACLLSLFRYLQFSGDSRFFGKSVHSWIKPCLQTTIKYLGSSVTTSNTQNSFETTHVVHFIPNEV
jgi:hypothetical protein